MVSIRITETGLEFGNRMDWSVDNHVIFKGFIGSYSNLRVNLHLCIRLQDKGQFYYTIMCIHIVRAGAQIYETAIILLYT